MVAAEPWLVQINCVADTIKRTTMRNRLQIHALVLALLVSGRLAASDDEELRGRELMMDEDTMATMHKSMVELHSDIAEMRDANSNDIKIRMMEKHMNAMLRQMDMMMHAMDGKPVSRHDHRKMK